jgi:ABC-type uncharacterized transport system ATPase subunit
MKAPEALLELQGISKQFGASKALADVRFTLRRGEIHALCGENGAGKSTLMKIIDGIHQPDSGDIYLEGERVVINGPAHAMRLGIGLVHQEISLCGDATVAENIFMPMISAGAQAWMDYAGLQERAAAVLRRLGQDIDPGLRVDALGISSQQLVEIARALTLDCKVLILDEPRASASSTSATAWQRSSSTATASPCCVTAATCTAPRLRRFLRMRWYAAWWGATWAITTRPGRRLAMRRPRPCWKSRTLPTAPQSTAFRSRCAGARSWESPA